MRARDEAISDFIGTILLVGVVVGLGGLLAVVIGANLEKTGPPATSLGLASVAPGDSSLQVVARNGEPLDLSGLRVTLQRNATAPVAISRGSWTTPDPTHLRAGDTLSFALSPAAGQDESLVVVVSDAASNAVVGQLATRTPYLFATVSPLGTPLLYSNLTPPAINADATTAALLTVRVVHPMGALGVASVTADLGNLTNASGTARELVELSDAGQNGDVSGGDGNWSALIRAPINTAVGTYNLTINATDLSGRVVASTWANLAITQNLATLIANVTAAAANITGNGTGNVTGNYTTCNDCTVTGGTIIFEGDRLAAPTSQNITYFHIKNWTYDRSNVNRVAGDAFAGRIVSNTWAWSMYFQFDVVNGVPGITRITLYYTNQTTVYLPTSGTIVSIVNLDLNMLSPTSNGFTCSSGCSPPALYSNAVIQGRPTFVLAYLRDESNNNNLPTDIGIFSVDLVMT